MVIDERRCKKIIWLVFARLKRFGRETPQTEDHGKSNQILRTVM